jgi:hypothetical protein
MAKQNVTLEQVMQLVASQAETIEALKTQLANGSNGKRSVKCKVGDAGGLVIQVSGFRYPTSLFITQFDAIAEHWDMICDFVKTPRSQFKTKDNA